MSPAIRHPPIFPFKNPIQTQFTQRTGYYTPTLIKLSADGQSVIFATYFGGPTAGRADAVRVDALGNIYTAGSVGDNQFTAKNAYQSAYPGAPCAFLAKFDPTMQNLIYATYFGGSSGGATEAFGVAVDSNGSAYIAGKATSADFPQKNSLQTFLGGGPDNADAFVAKFDPSGSTLIYSTLLGGHNEDGLGQIALDPNGDVYAAGVTVSSDFPVENAFQPTYGGGGDGVLLELSDNTPLSPSPLTITPGRVTFQFVQGVRCARRRDCELARVRHLLRLHRLHRSPWRRQLQQALLDLGEADEADPPGNRTAAAVHFSPPH